MPAGRQQRLTDWLRERGVTHVGETEWRQLLVAFSPVDERGLRRLLHQAGASVAQPFAGVRQKTLEELEDSLIGMESAYSAAVEASDRERIRYCRRVVIQAKDRARLARRNKRLSDETRALKQEMVAWMLVWLENPTVFPVWVQLRKTNLRTPTENGGDAEPPT